MNLNVELLQSLVAGWVAGAAVGLASTALWIVAVARRPALAGQLPRERRAIVFGIVFVNASVLVLTLVGLLLGALHYRVGGGPGGAFSLSVLGGAAILGAAYVFVRGSFRRAESPWVLVTLVLVAVGYGVMLPWLGDRPV